MSAMLSGINAIPEVIGSALFGARDACVEVMMPAPYNEPLLLGRVMAEVRATVELLESLGTSRWHGFVVRYETHTLVVRHVDGMIFVVLAGANVNLTMLNVGFNVAALKMQKPIGQSPSGQMNVPTNPGSGSAQVEALAKALAKYLGPMAKLILKEELNRVGGAQQIDALVAALSQRLDAGKRAAFAADAQAALSAR
jgi:predicted regulator of Ras-like GTPase activity (Roadblock/LC7/MglB family)